MKNPQPYRNLTHRPPKPALGNGKTQQSLRRCFLAYNGPISTSEALEWLYPLVRPDCSNVKKALLSIGAVKLKRLGGSARPLLWAPPSI